ncbi:MAG: hypothetical protein ACR2HM_04960 [Acidimicrobiales bacterium]
MTSASRQLHDQLDELIAQTPVPDPGEDVHQETSDRLVANTRSL